MLINAFPVDAIYACNFSGRLVVMDLIFPRFFIFNAHQGLIQQKSLKGGDHEKINSIDSCIYFAFVVLEQFERYKRGYCRKRRQLKIFRRVK
jgi:hypothetical protein